MMGSFAACCLFLPSVILAPYDWFGGPDFSSYRPLLVVLLRFLAAFALFDVLAILYGFAIRGAGDTRFSLLVLTGVGWGVLVAPLFILVWLEQLTLNRCWFFLTAAIAMQGILFATRFYGGRWQSMSVMKPQVLDR